MGLFPFRDDFLDDTVDGAGVAVGAAVPIVVVVVVIAVADDELLKSCNAMYFAVCLGIVSFTDW